MLIEVKAERRAAVEEMVSVLVNRHGQDPKALFLHALESRAEAELNYWTIRVLVEQYFVSATAPVGEDAAGEPVKPLHAAILLDNPGALAALLELKAYAGGMQDRDMQLAVRMARHRPEPALAALIMKHAEAQGALGGLMQALSPDALQ